MCEKEVFLVPLVVAGIGVESVIKQIGGKEEVRLYLENLGFVPGAVVTIVSEYAGNVIVRIKDSRIAISKEMAAKIMV